MKVCVKLLANYRDHLPAEARSGGAELELPDGATVRDAMSFFPIPLDETSVIVLNGRTVDLDTPLTQGDIVSAFSAIAGG